MKGLFGLMVAGIMIVTTQAFGRSPAGTPEFAAEELARQKMSRAYTPLDLQMRSNGKSIAIPAVNAKQKRVDFVAYTRKVIRRNGTYYYEVGQPEIVAR